MKLIRNVGVSTLLLSAVSGFLMAGPARCSTYNVTSLADDGGPGQLRAAIIAANADAGSTITFQSGLSGAITLSPTLQALPAILVSTTIQGPGQSLIAVDGRGTYRPFEIAAPGARVEISGLTIQNGADAGGTGGGGILLDVGALTLRDCTLSGNTATGNGGGLSNYDTATLINCTFSNNHGYNGGGIYNYTYSGSGGLTTLTNCTLTENSATINGGGVYDYTYSGTGGSSALTSTTLSGNTAGGNGAGIYNYSYSGSGGNAVLTNCVVTDNSGIYGGGIYDYTETGSGGTAILTDCTVADNSGIYTGGIYNDTYSGSGGNATLTDCILYGDAGGEIFGSVFAVYSDIQGGLPGTGNINADPLFINSEAGDFHLQLNSPCRSAGTTTGAPDTDKDGFTRLDPPSIGAYEALQLDLTPPVTTATLSGPPFANGFYSGPVTVTLTAADSRSGVANTFYQLDSGPQQTYTGPFTVSGDFTHLVTFYSVDNVGNAEDPAKSATFSIDSTPPVTTITSQPVLGGQKVTLTASDNFSGIGGTFYRVDSGSEHSYTGPFVVTGNFQHLVTAYSMDNALNTENPAKSLSFTVDTTGPVTTPALSAASYYNGFFRGPVTVTLSAAASSGIAGTFYRVDSGPQHPYTGSFVVSGDFQHLVTFYSVDNVGYAEGPAKSVTFSIDSTAPVTTITSQPVLGGQKVTLAASDNFSGPGGTFYRVDSGPEHSYTGPFVVTGNFQHLVTAYSIDRAGNAEATAQSLTFTVGSSPAPDVTGPVTTAALSGSPSSDGFFRGPVTVTLSAAASSGIAGTFYRVDSGPQHPYTGSFVVSGDFQHLVTFYSVDNVGYAEGPAKSVTFSIDSTAPVTILTSRSVSGGREVTLTATDNFSGIAGTFYRVDSGPQHPYTGPFVVTGAYDHLITAYSMDNAGNAEGPAKSLAF